MKMPFASTPLALLGAPNRPVSSPRTGRRRLPRSLEKGSARTGSAFKTRPRPSTRRARRDSSALRTPISRRPRRISPLVRASTSRRASRSRTMRSRSARAACSTGGRPLRFACAPRAPPEGAPPAALRLRRAREPLERLQVGAVARQQRCRRARHVSHVMKAAAKVGRIIARECGAQHVRAGERLARDQQALDRCLPLGSRALEVLPLLGDRRAVGAQLPALRLQPGQGSIGLRDGALGFAQGVARLLPLRLLRIELTLQRIDASPQRLHFLLARRALRAPGRAGEHEREGADQTLALPCAETAAMRFAISSASPR